MSGARRPQRSTLLEQTHTYLEKILRQPDSAHQRLQVLLCDDDTRHILTTTFTQTLLLSFQVVLVDALASVDQRYLMKHLHAVVLCRPTEKSVRALAQELQAGNFKTYRVYFTNLVDMDTIQKVANADVFDIVECIEEVFLDVVAVADNAGTVALRPAELPSSSDSSWVVPPSSPVSPAAQLKLENPITWQQWDANTLSRVSSSLIAAMLMTNRRPVIRYRKGNQVAERLAAELGGKMRLVHQSFPDLKAREAVLVITDRLDDPVTPLLTQWTYEAMIHELIGFQRDNEVVMDPGSGPSGGGREGPNSTSIPGETEEEAQRRRAQEHTHILSSLSDPFFAQHRYSDYGQVCVAVSELVEAYKSLNNKVDRTSASIDDIRNFMANFPEAKKQSSQVTKHASLMSHIVDEVNLRNLARVSVLEQDMIVNASVGDHSRTALDLVRNPKTDLDDALRIAMLYHLRYEKNSANITAQLKTELEQRGCPPRKIQLIDKVVEVAGANYRLHEIYRTSTGAMFKAAVSSIAQFGSEVQNVLTQHQPLLKKIVNRAYNGTLSDKDYPVQVVQGSPVAPAVAASQRSKDIMVFMIGGATFEEHLWIQNINKGQVDNNVETLMNLGLGVGKAMNVFTAAVATSSESTTATSPAAGGGDEPQTSKIEANCVLLSTATLNAKTFLRCLEGLL